MKDRLKNLLLALLLLLMCGLLGITMVLGMRNSRGGEQLLQALEKKPSHTAQLSAEAAAIPEIWAILKEKGAFLPTDREDTTLLSQQARELWQEALGSAGQPEGLEEDTFREKLVYPAIIVRYHAPQRWSDLRLWSGNERKEEGPLVRSFALVQDEKAVVLLLTDEKGRRYRAETAASSAELEELCCTPEINARLARDDYPGLRWETVLSDATVTAKQYLALPPECMEKGELPQSVQRLFSMNTYLTKVYQNADGSPVYVEGHSTLGTDTRGNLTYTSAEGMDLALSGSGDLETAICQRVTNLLQMLWQEIGADGNLSLEERSFRDGAYVFHYGLQLDGHFLEKQEDWAAVTVKNGAIIALTVSPRKLEATESVSLLPMIRAASLFPQGEADFLIRLLEQEDGFTPALCRVTEDTR